MKYSINSLCWGKYYFLTILSSLGSVKISNRKIYQVGIVEELLDDDGKLLKTQISKFFNQLEENYTYSVFSVLRWPFFLLDYDPGGLGFNFIKFNIWMIYYYPF